MKPNQYTRDEFHRTFTSLNDLYRQAKPHIENYIRGFGAGVRWVEEGSPDDVEKQIDCYIIYGDGEEHSVQIKTLNAKWSGLNTITLEHIEHSRDGTETTHNYRKCRAEFYLTCYFNPGEHKIIKLAMMRTAYLITAVDFLNQEGRYTVPKRNVCSSGKLIIIPLRTIYEVDPRVCTLWMFGGWNITDPPVRF